MGKRKQGSAMTLETVVVAILLLIVLVVLILVFTGYFRKADPYFSEPLAAAADQSCKVRGLRMKAEGQLPKENDLDEDERPDFVCDSCLCAHNKCPNGLPSNNDRDKNGNHIPDGCEDPTDKDDPWEDGCKRLDRNNAFEGKKGGNIVVFNKENNVWQCKLEGILPPTKM